MVSKTLLLLVNVTIPILEIFSAIQKILWVFFCHIPLEGQTRSLNVPSSFICSILQSTFRFYPTGQKQNFWNQWCFRFKITNTFLSVSIFLNLIFKNCWVYCVLVPLKQKTPITSLWVEKYFSLMNCLFWWP